MTTFRVIPSSTAAPQVSVNGRTYIASGGAQDVPAPDLRPIMANNWCGGIMSGPTSARPVPTPDAAYKTGPGTLFLDETLGYVIVFDGSAWRNPATGAAV